MKHIQAKHTEKVSSPNWPIRKKGEIHPIFAPKNLNRDDVKLKIPYSEIHESWKKIIILCVTTSLSSSLYGPYI